MLNNRNFGFFFFFKLSKCLWGFFVGVSWTNYVWSSFSSNFLISIYKLSLEGFQFRVWKEKVCKLFTYFWFVESLSGGGEGKRGVCHI